MDRRQAEGLQYLGIILAGIGVAFVYWPAALIVVGLAFVALAQAVR